jgi:hypothetical protein
MMDASAARPSGRLGHAALAAAVLIVAVAGVVLLVLPDRDRAAARPRHAANAESPRIAAMRPAPAVATVTIGWPPRTVSVPRSFFGLSTEYWSLPVYEQHMTLLERVISLLHVRGDGPFLLRVGGDSADHSFWEPRVGRTPPWVFGLTRSFLRATVRLVRRADVRLLLDLNLITGSPLAAAQWSHAAETGLPRRSIAGFEIGNEPDVYSRRYWLATVAQTPLMAGFLRKELSTATYAHEFDSYGRALAVVAPRVPLYGPALANPGRDVDWISWLIAAPHAGLATITVHRYVFSRCAPRRSINYPTVARLLSERASAVGRGVADGVRLAHGAGLRFRVTELNSVSCEGVPGVSDTFATALWAPDTLFGLLRAGLDGVNVHVRTGAINAAFTLSRRGLGARPLLYGLILFASALSPHPRLVRLDLRARSSLNLKAWGTEVSGRVLHLLLIDKGQRPASVRLQVPGRGPATVQRLLAPSAASMAGVTLGGRWLGRDGRWHGQLEIAAIPRAAGGYEVQIPQTSAALVSVRLPSRGGGRRHRA